MDSLKDRGDIMEMKMKQKFYPSKNILFWIYEDCESNEYYLVDVFPYPVLLFLAFYRNIFFNMKARKISEFELEQFQDSKRKNSSDAIMPNIGICIFLATLLESKLDQLTYRLNPFLPLFATCIFFLFLIIYLYKHRQREMWHQLEFNDAYIKVYSEKKGLWNTIKSWCGYLFFLVFLYSPMIFIYFSFLYDYITLQYFLYLLTNYSVIFMIVVSPIYPSNTSVILIKGKK